MSRLKDLIEELCPDGVEYKKIYDVCRFRRGKTITQKVAVPGDVPVVSGGKTPAYTHNEYNRDGEIITIAGSGAYAGHVLFWSRPIWVADAFSIEPIAPERLIPKYLYYWLMSKQSQLYQLQKGSGVPHVHGQDLDGFTLPLPPVEIQREIVRILDSMQELDDALSEELGIRAKQYAALKDELLSKEQLEKAACGELGLLELQDIAEVGSSKRFLKEQLVDSGIQFFRGTEVGQLAEGEPIEPIFFVTEEMYEDVKSKYGVPQVGDLLLPSVCPDGRVWMVDIEEPFYIKDARVLWVHTSRAKVDVDCRFMRYALEKCIVDNYRHLASGTSFAELKLMSLSKAPILLPPYNVQVDIADKLDLARALLQSRSNGIPAELDGRRKQFEYYRDKLLDFPEKAE